MERLSMFVLIVITTYSLLEIVEKLRIRRLRNRQRALEEIEENKLGEEE